MSVTIYVTRHAALAAEMRGEGLFVCNAANVLACIGQFANRNACFVDERARLGDLAALARRVEPYAERVALLPADELPWRRDLPDKRCRPRVASDLTLEQSAVFGALGQHVRTWAPDGKQRACLLVLAGPPGTGKTCLVEMLPRAFATAVPPLRLVSVAPSDVDLRAGVVQTTADLIDAARGQAIDALASGAARVVVFVDDLETALERDERRAIAAFGRLGQLAVAHRARLALVAATSDWYSFESKLVFALRTAPPVQCNVVRVDGPRAATITARLRELFPDCAAAHIAHSVGGDMRQAVLRAMYGAPGAADLASRGSVPAQLASARDVRAAERQFYDLGDLEHAQRTLFDNYARIGTDVDELVAAAERLSNADTYEYAKRAAHGATADAHEIDVRLSCALGIAAPLAALRCRARHPAYDYKGAARRGADEQRDRSLALLEYAWPVLTLPQARAHARGAAARDVAAERALRVRRRPDVATNVERVELLDVVGSMGAARCRELGLRDDLIADLCVHASRLSETPLRATAARAALAETKKRPAAPPPKATQLTLPEMVKAKRTRL